MCQEEERVYHHSGGLITGTRKGDYHWGRGLSLGQGRGLITGAGEGAYHSERGGGLSLGKGL